MKISFAAGFGPIVESRDASAKLYRDALAIPFDDPDGDYLMTDSLPGIKHFGLWTLADCAQACFGTSEWPQDRIVPQAGIEFDVESAEAVTEAANELKAKGFTLLVEPKTEPWGQTVTRLQTPEGMLVGITHTPWHHNKAE
jgi:catechol 2,3-dioxygenase-like lactoylglutathione lyase family enzyme